MNIILSKWPNLKEKQPHSLLSFLLSCASPQFPLFIRLWYCEAILNFPGNSHHGFTMSKCFLLSMNEITLIPCPVTSVSFSWVELLLTFEPIFQCVAANTEPFAITVIIFTVSWVIINLVIKLLLYILYLNEHECQWTLSLESQFANSFFTHVNSN